MDSPKFYGPFDLSPNNNNNSKNGQVALEFSEYVYYLASFFFLLVVITGAGEKFAKDIFCEHHPKSTRDLRWYVCNVLS